MVHGDVPGQRLRRRSTRAWTPGRVEARDGEECEGASHILHADVSGIDRDVICQALVLPPLGYVLGQKRLGDRNSEGLCSSRQTCLYGVDRFAPAAHGQGGR